LEIEDILESEIVFLQFIHHICERAKENVFISKLAESYLHTNVNTWPTGWEYPLELSRHACWEGRYKPRINGSKSAPLATATYTVIVFAHKAFVQYPSYGAIFQSRSIFPLL
jgi:hypothetical protein